MEEIIIESQKDWDDVPKEFQGYVYIQSPPSSRLVITEQKGYKVVAMGNSHVDAWENSYIVARGNSQVEAQDNSQVDARENSYVVAWENSNIVVWENSNVVARGNSQVEAWENSKVVARGSSHVMARESSQVIARENSQVMAWETSKVEARENSNVVAWENSQVMARDNSHVDARDNSHVVAMGNVQIAQYSECAKIEVSGNARIVRLPQTIQEYCDFHGITVKDGAAVLYKAVQPDGSSFYDKSFFYVVGETVTERCDPSDDDQCSYGIHVAHLHWAIDFGSGRGRDFKIIECAVPLGKIIIPRNNDGKVRTSELLVLREVPMEEWGIYGKILARKVK